MNVSWGGLKINIQQKRKLLKGPGRLQCNLKAVTPC